MSFERYIPNIGRLLTAALLLLGVSCVKDEPITDGEGMMDDDRVSIVASISANDQTRSDDGLYIDDGVVDRGTFYLFYNTPYSSSENYYHKIAMVDFGNPEGPNTGYAYVFKEDGVTRKDLKWNDIYNKGTSSLYYYLTNVPPESYTVRNYSYNSTYDIYYYSNYFRFIQTNGKNPYVAGPLDEIDGTNDLLSGYLYKSVSSTSTDRKLQFNLNHALSLLKIVIEVYPAEVEGFTLDLTNASIRLTNVAQTVGSYSLTAYSTNYMSSFTYTTATDLSSSTTSYYSGSGLTMNMRDLVMVDPKQMDDATEADEESAWKYRVWDTAPDNINSSPAVYITKRFVMPPQNLPPTGSDRPQLLVTVPTRDMGFPDALETDSVKYRGYIPLWMFDTNGTPQTIALKSGTQLTITATINSPNPGLIFAPVKVEPWMSKGTFTFNMRQAGIYNASDFKALLDLYAELQKDLSPNERDLAMSNLEKYGYRGANGDLIFQLWANLTLYKDKIENQMPVIDGKTPDFSFMFNGYSVTLVKKNTPETDDGDGDDDGNDDGDNADEKDNSIAPGEDDIDYEEIESFAESTGQFSFYKLLTGTGEDLEFKGIKSKDDFWDALALLQSDTHSLIEMMQYGVLNNIDETIIFDIDDSFTLNADEFERIYQTLPEKLWEYDIQFTIHDGQKVQITIPVPEDKLDVPFEEGENVVVCEPGYCPLNQLIIKRAARGIATPDDFYFLTDCYNRYYWFKPEILNLFGTGSNTSRTFYFLNAMTLDGSKTYLKMVPNTNVETTDRTYRPSYNVYANSSYFTIKIVDEKLPAAPTLYASSYGSSYTLYYSFKNMLSGQIQRYSSPSLTDIVSYYNNNSYNQTNYAYHWRYGRFDFEQNKWFFPLNTTNLNISYAGLFGQMIPNDSAGKYDYEFELSDTYYFYVSSMPVSDEEGASTATHYFYQNGSEKDPNGKEIDYPNDATALKYVADGTYWDYFKTWQEQIPEPEPEPDPAP